MSDPTPTPTPEQIEWAAELAGCESWFRGQTRIVCETHGDVDWPCPVAVDLAAKIAARDARRDAQTRADECDARRHSARQCQQCTHDHSGEAMPVMPRPDEARRTLLIDWLASIGLNADDIPDDPGALTVTRDSLGALHVHWLEVVVDDDGNLVIDEPTDCIVTRAREKYADATPPGWTDGTDPWDAWAWIHLPVIGEDE